MQLAFGVARKRLEEMQNQRKARLPVALEQRLGRSKQNTLTPDRRTSTTPQVAKQQPQYSAMPDFGIQQISQIYEPSDSFIQSMHPRTDVRSSSFDYTNNQQNGIAYVQSSQDAAATNNNLSFGNMSSSNDSSQFGGVNWMVSLLQFRRERNLPRQFM